jgi:GTP-binding protein LepA
MDKKKIRNFSIVAHIDHGKSTLCDRILEVTGLIKKGMHERTQILDSMELERKHGVTIKSHPITLQYQTQNGDHYTLNLIDTPGHIDFSYEVSRSLAATEGVVLLVDASQGIEAQTLAHFNHAKTLGKTILPVINKIDLPTADVPGCKKQLCEVLKIHDSEIVFVSAKTGKGVKGLLDTICERIPAPVGRKDGPVRALIFDSFFDPYRGSVVYIKVVDGKISKMDIIRVMSTGKSYTVQEVGIFRLSLTATPQLQAGEVGYIIAGIKDISDIKVGDTITTEERPADSPLPGYENPTPFVFCSLYPQDSTQYPALSDAVRKLHLNDSSWVYRTETSPGFGSGFRCGFLGLFHMQIIQERLEHEYGLSLIATTPSVSYRVKKKGAKEAVEVKNPVHFPPPHEVESVEEPYVEAFIIVPQDYIGSCLKLCEAKRGIQKELTFIDERRILVKYELPLQEILVDFYDRLKSATQGYASFDYSHIGFKQGDLVKLSILVAGNPIDSLSVIVPRDRAFQRGKEIVLKLKSLIPRQQFQVSLQSAIGGKIIARENIPALRKHVTGKCYGGDITRKRKLWEKQKMGKKRLKQIGRVNVPQEAFEAILRID